jgi:hypothetical protein
LALHLQEPSFHPPIPPCPASCPQNSSSRATSPRRRSARIARRVVEVTLSRHSPQPIQLVSPEQAAGEVVCVVCLLSVTDIFRLDVPRDRWRGHWSLVYSSSYRAFDMFGSKSPAVTDVMRLCCWLRTAQQLRGPQPPGNLADSPVGLHAPARVRRACGHASGSRGCQRAFVVGSAERCRAHCRGSGLGRVPLGR